VLKTSPAAAPLASCPVVHALLTVAVWASESLFVQTITSPTLALTGSGENAKFLIETLTVAAVPAAATVQGAPADEAEAAADDGLDPAAEAADDGLAPAAEAEGELVAALPPHAARAVVTITIKNVEPRRRMRSFPPTGLARSGPEMAQSRNDTSARGLRFSSGYRARVTTPSRAGSRVIDARVNRWLAFHEARSHALVGREVRDLGDAVLLHDQADREPFWNRVAGVAWPREHAAFDRRLAEVLTLFASLDRIPHIWPQPGFDEPPDLVDRLIANGFSDMGSGMLMSLDPARLPLRPAADLDGNGISVERLHRLAGPRVADVVRDVAIVLADAFGMEPDRRSAIEEETMILLGHEEFHVCLIRVDGEPAAAARRTTFDGASYLSSIGTRQRFRGRGLGRVVTDVVTRDALAAGSDWTYLGVFADNVIARSMYEGLGYVPIGGPAPDLLLQ
jgi:ribosomal protein S18 acetylase RimI-like enzyme